jgi:mannose-1-phosphate guanylyltransferase
MFIWQAATIIKAFEKHLPTISRTMETILPALNGPDEAGAIRKAYGQMENISIDFGVMEKADRVLVIEADVAWNDVGSWNSLEDVWGTDQDGNAVNGKLVSLESRGCTVSSPHKLTALVGVQDLIVVDTEDALLICDKDRAQDVKELLDILKNEGYDELL